MIPSIFLLLSSLILSCFASPIEVRNVTSLNQAAFEEAQQRDDTTTRAFSGVEIKTSTGQCLFINELSGDFRANLNPIQVAACDGSTGQLWDVITSGKHNNQNGAMLLVNTLTQACMNFDPRRATGNTVIMFSCGGRADGGGTVTNSQLFTFTGGVGPLLLAPINVIGTCLAVTSNNVLDQAPCNTADASQSFTFSGGGSSAAVSTSAISAASSLSTAAQIVATSAAAESTNSNCGAAVTVTVTRPASSSSAFSESIPTTTIPAASSSPSLISSLANAAIPSTNPTASVPVSRAGGVLQPSSAAEANPPDLTATKAFSSISLKAANGQCLFVDPTAGDFRENLIPVSVQECTGSANEKWDIITSGVHNNVANSTLVVSSLTNGCLNFDSRRAAGDTVILFSCGGRADGGGQVTNSQLFPYTGGNTILLAPENADGCVCLVPNGRKLDQAACVGSGQSFTIS